MTKTDRLTEQLRALALAHRLQSMMELARYSYNVAVSDLAVALRRGLKSGKLRAWEDGDADRYRDEEPPFFLLEDEVERRYIRGRPERAGLVLLASASVAQAAKITEGPGVRAWKDTTVAGLACAAMALDVVACAEERGWTSKARRAA